MISKRERKNEVDEVQASVFVLCKDVVHMADGDSGAVAKTFAEIESNGDENLFVELEDEEDRVALQEAVTVTEEATANFDNCLASLADALENDSGCIDSVDSSLGETNLDLSIPLSHPCDESNKQKSLAQYNLGKLPRENVSVYKYAPKPMQELKFTLLQLFDQSVVGALPSLTSIGAIKKDIE
jgi:hypothetical protein